MRYVRILLHSVLSLAPLLGIRWLVILVVDRSDPAALAYGPGCACLFLIFLPVISFVPLAMAAAARDSIFSRKDPAMTPLHPVGWVTLAGMWGHIPALWGASKLSGDLAPVSFSFLGPPLIVLSVILSWRYVEKRFPPQPPTAGFRQETEDG